MNEEQQLRDEPEARPRSRRDLLKVAGAGAAAIAGAKMLAPSDASANNGDPLTLGSTTNSASLQTLLTSSFVHDDPVHPEGGFRVDAPNADLGIYGTGKAYGIGGLGPGGVLGLGTVGGVFSGSSVAINLDPQANPGAPTGQAFKGDLAVDSTGVLYFCVVGSPQTTPPFSPGTWIRVTNPVGAIVPLAAPVRVLNTTDGTGGVTGPLVPGATVHTTNSLIGVAGIPATAVGVVGTLAISGVGGALLNGFGFATIYPAGVATPAASNITAGAGCFAISNAVTVAFGTGGNAGKLSFVWAGGGPVPNAHAFLDVAGYF
jgi:hypothetical protein